MSSDFAAMAIVVCLTGATVGASAAGRSKLELPVFVYSHVPGLALGTIEHAENKAAGLILLAGIKLLWVDCVSAADTAECQEPPVGALVVRLCPRALPAASHDAVGAAVESRAWIYYDRLRAMEGGPRSLSVVLGLVMAHEIGHLLLPGEPHANSGLMKATVTPQDLDAGSTACKYLSKRTAALMRREARRRMGGWY
jgi:hypothetical protein